MNRNRQHRFLCLLTVGALLGACGGHGDPGNAGASAAPSEDAAPSDSAAPSASAASSAEPGAAEAIPTFTYKTDDAATGPAPAVPGASPGGTVKVYDVVDNQHLDPARIYNTQSQNVFNLIGRALTGYRESGTTVTLVGDLATNTGVPTDGGKSWTYTLRDGISWEDGSPITAGDVKYGLERTFVKDYPEGPTYFQSWIADSQDFTKFYSGPYGKKSLKAITTPDDKTLKITFKKPHPDLPYAFAFPFAGPVKQSKDTKAKYDQLPFSSGPYRIADRKIDKSMTLERNPNWKPESDPIRTAYPDRWEFSFGELPIETNKRLMAAAGDDAHAMTLLDRVSPEVLPTVLGTPDLLARTTAGLTIDAGFEVINTKRITDLRVRKAIMYAYPRQQIRQLLGGPDNGEFSTTLSSPTLIGHEQFDLFHVPPAGDPEMSRKLLKEAGKLGMTLVVPYANLPRSEQVVTIEAQAFTKAGFKVVKKVLNPRTAGDEIAKVDNKFDVYGGAWVQDWPSGATVFPPLFDGRTIRDGGVNNSFFNDPAVNKEMDEIQLILDPVEAGRRWSQLERKILAQVPAFPDLYGRSRQLHGPKIGGTFLSTILAGVSTNNIYVIP